MTGCVYFSRPCLTPWSCPIVHSHSSLSLSRFPHPFALPLFPALAVLSGRSIQMSPCSFVLRFHSRMTLNTCVYLPSGYLLGSKGGSCLFCLFSSCFLLLRFENSDTCFANIFSRCLALFILLTKPWHALLIHQNFLLWVERLMSIKSSPPVLGSKDFLFLF